jgi:riboflavin kinase / FMN adenylyltransferase
MLRPTDIPSAAVTPGNHDGVHLGHRALVEAAKARADATGSRTVGMFFDPHPTRVLAPERAPTLLTTPARRTELLREAGCDDVVVKTFDSEFASTAPRVFVEEILVRACNARCVVTGPDFQFGRGRAGNIDTLRALGEEYGFEVLVVPPALYQGEPSSSTRVRCALADGDVGSAAAMLTRLHDTEGVVVQGDRRGRTLGFPTANLDPDETLHPKDGVYLVAVRDLTAARSHLGVANLGTRPTVAAGRSVEVHLFDFDGDLYGHRLRVGYAARLRDEQRFPNVDALRAQIERDVAEARRMLADESFRRDPERLRRWL